jgi:hypothetical protein
MASDDLIGNNGAFLVPVAGVGFMQVIASDGRGWEHVSASLPDRCPTWAEMCVIKDMFWTDDDTVIQYHPAKDDYVNKHPYCLHLWRPTDILLPLPPTWMVG